MTESEINSLLQEPREHLGDWESEYRALVDTCALGVRHDRGVVRVTGERAAEMLNGLLTQQLKGLAGAGRHALLLSAKGRVLTDLRVLPQSAGLLLDVPRAGLANLLASFKKYLPPLYARYEDLSAELIQLGLYGPRAAAVLSDAIGAEAPAEHLAVDEQQIDHATVMLIRNRRLVGDGVELVLDRTAAAAVTEKLLRATRAEGGGVAGVRALNVVRVESGVPDYGVDMDESNLAQETGLEAEAISYDKGCYLGQEVVARVHFRGHVNRHLRSLSFRGTLPEHGVALLDQDKEVGVVTSAVVSPEYGPIGLGYVRREISPSHSLSWSGAAGRGEALVSGSPFRTSTV